MSVAIETPRVPAAPARRRSALARLTVTELTLFLREPMLVFWVIAFPLLLLVIFGLIPSFKQTHPGYQGLTVLETYVPIIIVTARADTHDVVKRRAFVQPGAGQCPVAST